MKHNHSSDNTINIALMGAFLLALALMMSAFFVEPAYASSHSQGIGTDGVCGTQCQVLIYTTWCESPKCLNRFGMPGPRIYEDRRCCDTCNGQCWYEEGYRCINWC